MNKKIIFIKFILLIIILFPPAGKYVFGGTMEEILQQEIKCPDHDRPEIISTVKKMSDEGKSKDEILDAVSMQFGGAVLINPREKGAGMAMAYIVPVAGFALALILISAFIGKWIKINKSHEESKNAMNVQSPGDGKDKYEIQFEEEYKAYKERV
ncbi:cytochrome c-type biogenesis protein CcmH [Candidatus Desantisbacteria bacterium]|nr:cytochrome c-type biogenesis protein CcmH [Candidatus Desantisbacteria bacterium]